MKIIMLRIIIMFLIVATYAACHIGVYVSLTRFFSITDDTTRMMILFALFALASSFFVAMVLSHWKDNIFTRGAYFFSGFWVGLLVNLCIFFFLAWISVLLGKLLGYSGFSHSLLGLKAAGIAAIVLALAYSVFGVWNAFTPNVTMLDVKIKGLPEKWIGKKIVQISDVHLGHIYRADYMNGIADKIMSLHPDAVMITGDLFDGMDGNLGMFAEPLEKIKAPEGVYFITGNHEAYLGVDKALAVIDKTDIVPLRDGLRSIDGLQIIGIDYQLRDTLPDIGKLVPAMKGYDPKAPSILLIHEPVGTDAAKKLGIGLQLSGHTHKGQLFPFGMITSLIFHGYDYGLKREGDYSIYTSSGLGGWGPPMRTEARSEIVEITLH